jgi:hypothetical protein
MTRLSAHPSTTVLACLAALGSLALIPFAGAQTKSTVPPAAPPAAVAPDFKPGFAALHRLGVTNVSRATFVSFSGLMQYQMRGGRSELTGSLQRFGWQLAGDASSGVFLLADGITVRRASSATPVASPNMYGRWNGDEDEMELAAATQTVEGVTWKAADLDAETTRLTEKLQKAVAKRDAALAKSGAEGEEMTRRMMQMSGQSAEQLAPVLFFATHVADQGRTQEANQLVAQAINLAGSRQSLLEAAVNELAGSAYLESWRRFRSSGDWSSYGRDLSTLVTRFARGWRDATNAVELARRVQVFTAAGRKPAALPNSLTAAERALADALATAPRPGHAAGLRVLQPGFWVLPPDTNDMMGAWISTNAHPLARLLRGGTNSIPVLLAMLDDHTTLTQLATTRALVQPVADESGSDEMAMMMRRDLMMRGVSGGFPHPASRADIAAILLEPLVGQNESSYRSSRGRPAQGTPKSLADRVRTWQAAHAGLGLEEIAFRNLTSRDYSAVRQSATYLARSSSTSAWQRLEQHILRSRDPDNLADVAEQYVRHRGKQALPFVEAYAKRLSGGAPAADVTEDVDPQLFNNKAAASDQYAKYRQKQAARIVARLKRIVESKPATAVLDEVAAGKLTLGDAREELQDLWRMPPQDLLNAFVTSAAKASNSTTRVELLSATEWIPRMMQYHMYAPPAARVVPDKALLSPLPAADAWRQLLADTRLPTNSHPVAWQPATTVRACAAAYMERVCAPGATGDVSTLVNRLGEPACDLLLRRAASRLSGAKDVQPPLPDASRVPASRLLALTNAAPSAAVLAGLTPDERLALALAALQNPALAPAIAVHTHRVRIAPLPAELAAAGAALKAGADRPLSVAFLRDLAAQCVALAKQGQRVTFELRQAPGFAGVEASVRLSRPDDAQPSPAGGVAVSMLRCEGSDERFVHHPGAAPAKPPVAEDPLKRPTDDELLAAEVSRIERGPLSPAEAEAAAWKRVDAFCVGDESIGFPAILAITAVPTS